MPNDTQRVSDVLEVSLGRGTLLKDDLTGVANVLVEVFDSTGALKDSRAVHNLVVDAGKTHIAAVTSSGGAKRWGASLSGLGPRLQRRVTRFSARKSTETRSLRALQRRM